MSRPNTITRRGLDKLTREIQWLQKVERPKITAEVSYAASLGDRSENAEYIYGKKRLREIDARMRFLIGRLDHVVAVDPAEQGPRAKGKVLFGATVTVEDEEGRERTWRIFGEDEVDLDRGIISHVSPLGRALLGKEAGDEVRFAAPAGERAVTLVEVRYEAQDPLPDDLEAWRIRG